MSQLPKPPAASSIAAKTTKSIVATLEHEALLRVVWRDFQTLVKARLAFLSDAARKAVVPAQQQHTALAERAMGSVTRRLGAADLDDKDRQVLLDALPKLEAYLKRPLPELDNGNFIVTIERAALAVPFSEHESTRTARSAKPVGFIDIACSVTYPVEVTVQDGIPFQLTGLDSGMWAIAKAGHFHRELTFSDPQWVVTHQTVPVWIDIRPELPPVGQLLRELRTLEHYAPANTIIWLITGTVDPEVEQMLLHGGYLVSTGEWATKTAQVSS